jgi:serine/threonine protein kinase
MVKSDHSVRLHQTIKTSQNIYMMQEYANGYDLSVLLKVRQKIKQDEARIILSQLVVGIKDVWDLGIIHRDMKLANILLHFPDKMDLEGLTRPQKKSFLASVDLTRVKFQVKISDFGLSTILDGTNTQLSICGTPLYSSP